MRFPRIDSVLKKIIYPGMEVRAFVVTRLTQVEIREKVFIKNDQQAIEITNRHCLACLDPFIMAIWLNEDEPATFNHHEITLSVTRGNKQKALIQLSLSEKFNENNIVILLYKVKDTKSLQSNPLLRFITLARFLKNKTSTYRERKFIAALYSYPRKVILVSYKEAGYFNLFPMDIQGDISANGIYLLGLRHSNITLQKILETKKILIGDTSKASIETIYSLGRHFSKSPPTIDSLPFEVSESGLFKFPVPDFSSSYKEVEIIKNINLGYHMLLIGRIVNQKQITEDLTSLYHIHFFEFIRSGYKAITNKGYS